MHQKGLISQATMKNWERLNIEQNDIENKLTQRANKRFSQKTIIPVEYFSNKDNLAILHEILSKNIELESCIYTLALNLLLANNLIKFDKNNKITTDNPYILEILTDFENAKIEQNLLAIKLPTDEQDFLGIVYQSLINEGKKNKQGSYYTPKTIIKGILKDLNPQSKYLDPCCGTGNFLLTASETISQPQNIYGYDIDKTACFIAKINLVLKFKTKIFRPNIFNRDFILENNDEKFDIIATNPPWGAIPNPEYEKHFPQITSKESFSYFITKTSSMIGENGQLCFVLPESILNVKTHKDIRKFILQNLSIKEIEVLGQTFSGVLSGVIIIHLSKSLNTNVTIKDKTSEKILPLEFFKTNTNYNFSIIDNMDVKILEKIYSIKHSTLNGESKWGLGIVTGNNSKHITKDSSNGEKIYSGKNIKKGEISETDNYIIYDRKNFQQCAPDDLYRAKEKLVYKFISKNLTFAYDNKQRLFLNSANILIPKIEGYDIQMVMTFLNSTLFQYIYEKKFNELKVLKGNLSELPFPSIELINNKTQISDDEIFRIFNLTTDEITHIKNEIK